MINPDALEAGPYPKKISFLKKCQGETSGTSLSRK